MTEKNVIQKFKGQISILCMPKYLVILIFLTTELIDFIKNNKTMFLLPLKMKVSHQIFTLHYVNKVCVFKIVAKT